METDSQHDDTPSIPAQRTPAKRTIALAALVAIAVVCAAAAGVWLHAHKPQLIPADAAPGDGVDLNAPPEPKPIAPVSAQTASPDEDAAAVKARLNDLDQLRQVLESKKSAILQAKHDYRYGILELEDETRRVIRHARIDSVGQALKHSGVESLLRNIQRRQIYFEALDQPLGWIESASEGLLYVGRRAAIDLLVQDVAAGVDMRGHLMAIGQALERYQPNPGRLSIDPASIPAASLEVIAKGLIEQARALGGIPADRRRPEIEAEICSGNLSRAAELSTLSLRGARCLAESDAKQLFLNRLSELTPLGAEALSKWTGEWLCVNGIARLDPEAAAHLFAWRGRWLSLNGLVDLPPETGKHLAGWDGRQLELMGLRQTADASDLAKWESRGGRLFVPDAIRSAIDRAGAQ